MQCSVARARVASLNNQLDVILTSPLLRCLQTTAAVAPKGVPVVVVPDLRECWVDQAYLCEAPLEPHAASTSGPWAAYDWSLCLEAADAATAAAAATAAEANCSIPAIDEPSGEAAAPGAALSSWEADLLRGDGRASFLGNATGLFARAKRLTEYVRRRPELTIGIVSHAAFLDILTTDAALGRMENCEVRTYDVVPRGRMGWRRLEKLAAPSADELMDAATLAAAEAARDKASGRPPSRGAGGVVCEAEGRVRGGQLPGGGYL